MYACIMGCLRPRGRWHMKRVLSFSFIFLGALVCPGRSCGYQFLDNRAAEYAALEDRRAGRMEVPGAREA